MSLRKARKDAENAIKEIRKYSRSNDRHALLRRVVLGDQLAPISSNTISDSFILDLQSLIDGGIFAKDFVENMDNLLSGQEDTSGLEETIKETIRLTVPDDSSVANRDAPYINGEHLFEELPSNNLLTIKKSSTSKNIVTDVDSVSFNNPSKNNPSLVVFEILNPKISINARETDATSIFLSMIPTLELSRCVPYINVSMFNEEAPSEKEEKLFGLSLVSFLVGKNQETKSLTSLDQASVLSLRPTNSDIPSGATSMELFTSPQTLVPQKGSSVFSERGNIPAVLDRFRPPMSLISFNVSVKPSTGFMSYKTATMELVLHDRSRLHEISNLVRPGVNNKTEMTIEYGWSNNFKGSPESNAFAAFMNSLKIREKYGIVNSSFRFDETGQVIITLNLFTKGIQQMEQMPMTSFGVQSADIKLFKVLDEISEIIAERKGTTKFNSIFDQTLIEAFSSSNALLSLDQKELKKLEQTLAKIRDNKDTANEDLVKKIDSVLGSGDGSLSELRKSTDNAINTALSALNSGTEIFPCNLSQLTGFKSVSFPAVSVKDRRSISSKRQAYDKEVEAAIKLKQLTEEREERSKRIKPISDELQRSRLIADKADAELRRATAQLQSLERQARSTAGSAGVQAAMAARNVRKALEAARAEVDDLAAKRQELEQQLREARTKPVDLTLTSEEKAEARIEAQKSLKEQGISPPSSGLPATRTIQTPISLGRLLVTFIGESLRNSNSFDEIQFMFHTFNEKASFVRQMSIAKFPIDFNDFKKKITEQVQKNPKISVMNTLQFILSEFVNDMSVKPYGFSFLYEQEKDSEDKPTGRLVRKQVETDAARKKEESEQDKVLQLAGINDGKFKLPNVQIIPECVPNLEQPEKTILRLHVVDTQTTNHETLFSLIKSMRQGSFAELSSEQDGPHPLFPESPELKSKVLYRERTRLIEELKKQIVEKPANTSASDSSTETEVDLGKLLEGKSITETKRFVSEGMPTIFFGGSSGAIKSIGLTSMNDSRLSTVNILRMNKEPDLPSETIRNRGLPMQVLPVECSIETLGCPLFERMQHFFIDFGTGTTADNVYVVNEIEHKLGPGEFSTSLKMIFLDSFMAYSSSRRKVKIANDILAKEFKVQPESSPDILSPKKPVTKIKHTGSKQILTVSNSLVEITALKGARGRLLFIVLDETFTPIWPYHTPSSGFVRPINLVGNRTDRELVLKSTPLNSAAKFVIDISELLRGREPLERKSGNIKSDTIDFEIFEVLGSSTSLGFGASNTVLSQINPQIIATIESIYGPKAGILKADAPSPGGNRVLLDATDYSEFLQKSPVPSPEPQTAPSSRRPQPSSDNLSTLFQGGVL